MKNFLKFFSSFIDIYLTNKNWICLRYTSWYFCFHFFFLLLTLFTHFSHPSPTQFPFWRPLICSLYLWACFLFACLSVCHLFGGICLFVCFQISHIREIIQCLPFFVWLIPLNLIPLSFIHLARFHSSLANYCLFAFLIPITVLFYLLDHALFPW